MRLRRPVKSHSATQRAHNEAELAHGILEGPVHVICHHRLACLSLLLAIALCARRPAVARFGRDRVGRGVDRVRRVGDGAREGVVGEVRSRHLTGRPRAPFTHAVGGGAAGARGSGSSSARRVRTRRAAARGASRHPIAARGIAVPRVGVRRSTGKTEYGRSEAQSGCDTYILWAGKRVANRMSDQRGGQRTPHARIGLCALARARWAGARRPRLPGTHAGPWGAARSTASSALRARKNPADEAVVECERAHPPTCDHSAAICLECAQAPTTHRLIEPF